MIAFYKKCDSVIKKRLEFKLKNDRMEGMEDQEESFNGQYS